MKEFKYFSGAGSPAPERSTAGREFPSQLPNPTTVLRSAAALLKQFADSAPSLFAPQIRNRGLTETRTLVHFFAPFSFVRDNCFFLVSRIFRIILFPEVRISHESIVIRKLLYVIKEYL